MASPVLVHLAPDPLGLESRGNLSLGPPGTNPIAMAYDNLSGTVFVTLAPTYVTELSGTPPRVDQTVSLGANSSPAGLAFDPVTNTVLVATFPGSLTILSATNLSVLGMVRLGFQPVSMVYDPSTRNVYAGGDAPADSGWPGSSNLTVINGSSYELSKIPNTVASIYPLDLEYDPVTGLIVAVGLAGLTGGYGAVAFNTTSGSTQWVDPGGATTLYTGVTVDTRTGDVFVAQGTYQFVAVLNGTTGAVIVSISLGTGHSESTTVQFGPASNNLIVGHLNQTIEVVNASGSGAEIWLSIPGIPSFSSLNTSSDSPLVLSSDTASITSISANGTAVLGTSNVGGGPNAVAFDSTQGLIYVAGSDNVSVVDPDTGAVIASVRTGANPNAVLFNPDNQTIYVADTDNQSLTVISTLSNTVIATVRVDPDPFALTWDNVTDSVYVACLNYSGTEGVVDVVSASSEKVTARISTGSDDPDGIAFVPGLNELFVANTCIYVCYPPANLTVISGATNQILANISLPVNATFTPGQVTYDPGNGDLYVAGSGATLNSAYIDDVVVDPSNRTEVALTPIGPGPYGLVVLPTLNAVVATSWINNTVNLLNSTSNRVTTEFREPLESSPEGLAFDPAQQEIFVADWGNDSVTVLALIQSYPVTFTELGLPSGTDWSISVVGQALSSNATSIVFNEPNGSFSYAVEPVSGFSIPAPTGSILVTGKAVAVSVEFERLYSVQFEVAGLPAGTPWGVSLGTRVKQNITTPTGGAIGFIETNGSYGYSIEGVAGYHESGLPYQGTLVVNGANLSEPLEFGAVSYTVLFSEFGLPVGTEWNLTFNGVEGTSRGNSLQFSEPNGTYGFVIGALPGWHPSTSKWVGSVVISGGGLTEVLSWIQTTYTVSFQEAGLPNGTNWMLTVAGEVSNSHSQFIQVQLTNGSYSFQILSVQGYTSTPPSGVIRVTGQNMTESIQFATAAATASGLSPLLWTLAVSGAGLTVAALLFVYLARRRRHGRGGETSDSPRSGVA